MNFKAMATVVTVLSLSAGIAVAASLTIAGPTLTDSDSGYTATGLEFLANQNSTLTGFIFQNQGAADIVELVSSAGTVLNSITTPGTGSVSSYAATVSWTLTSGQDYYLVQTIRNNGRYTSFGLPPPSNAHISIVDSGLFSGDSNILDNTFTANQYWADFNNITTTTAVPLPAAVWLLLSGLGGLGFMRRRQAS